MAIIRLSPACKDYLWGGTRLKEDFGIKSDLVPTAEAWVLSCHPDGPSRLPDGTSLPDYIAAHSGCLGTHCAGVSDLPLIKLIDAKKDLSIQVHPSDDYAWEHEGQPGKTEMWYVLDCEPGAFLYYGFSQAISQAEFARRIRDNSLPEVLNAVPVKKGDLFFIPAGTLHAIGGGIVIAEVQQNSNVTYRVCDYGRLGADGKPRALHIEQALAVTECRPPQKQFDFGGHLAKCSYFTVDVFSHGFAEECGPDSFVSLLVTEGSGRVHNGDETVTVRRGDSLFLPAGSGRYEVSGDCTVLRTFV